MATDGVVGDALVSKWLCRCLFVCVCVCWQPSAETWSKLLSNHASFVEHRQRRRNSAWNLPPWRMCRVTRSDGYLCPTERSTPSRFYSPLFFVNPGSRILLAALGTKRGKNAVSNSRIRSTWRWRESFQDYALAKKNRTCESLP
ncbi:hypothetical protein K504DRAFT_232161 [Pleomassaria siparia CBS 279.74]|uniref:Secreted protein n=1 Tax=Pleomassaria siparia CBS 279.74 TaxID=1314801 RepID=A0A6G1KGK0_9PLEO|nr:hypothetical protein K504DRAFT_232161 [Pleomassaria siparia CBS 279.74]